MRNVAAVVPSPKQGLTRNPYNIRLRVHKKTSSQGISQFRVQRVEVHTTDLTLFEGAWLESVGTDEAVAFTGTDQDKFEKDLNRIMREDLSATPTRTWPADHSWGTIEDGDEGRLYNFEASKMCSERQRVATPAEIQLRLAAGRGARAAALRAEADGS